MKEQLKKVEADQKFYQDHDAHLLEADIVVRVVMTVIVAGFAIIGFFWFIDNAIMPLVRMARGV